MGSGYKNWTAGDVPTADEFDGYLQRQTVMTFATAAARDSALSGVLDEGMLTYQEDTNQLTSYDGAAWQIIAWGVAAGRVGGTWTRSATQSISNNTLTNVSWDAETFDSAGFLTPTSTTIGIPSGLGGLYVITAIINYATPTLGINYVQINVSGGSRTFVSVNTGALTGMNVQTITALLPLTAGESIVIQTLHNNGGAQNIQGCRVDIYRLGI